LNRETCLSAKGVRTFLKLSRLGSDDILRQRLNSVIDKSRNIEGGKEAICEGFVRDIIYPAWKSRERAIEYCSEEVKTMGREIEEEEKKTGGKRGDEEHEYNLRIDPYAERDGIRMDKKKYETIDNLSNWLNNETLIEGIVRDRSLEILGDTCF
ncbi:Mix23p ASCRUDRAFT_21315, partial [Ascoidea rubescens DSM 1968]